MNLSAENIGKIRELVRNGYPLKARDAKDLLGHNDHLVELLEARGRLMLGVEIERDQLRAEVAGLKTGYEAYERVNAELKAENEALRKDAERLQSATAFVQKLCDSAGKQPSVATGYLHDILSAMGKEEQS